MQQFIKTGNNIFKPNNLFIATILVASVLLAGCSQSDGKSTSETSSWTPDTEVLVMHGHTLPPEPDPAVNNASLLGVDSNDNGVRDDVERWIYKDRYNTYIPCEKVEVNVTIPATGETVTGFQEECADEPVDYHQIVREIAMQGARAAQIIIQEPEKARETREVFAKAYNCAFYFETWAKYHNEPILLDHYIFGDEFKEKQFNTAQRVSAFAKYNITLSGGIYSDVPDEIKRSGCDFNISKLLKK